MSKSCQMQKKCLSNWTLYRYICGASIIRVSVSDTCRT